MSVLITGICIVMFLIASVQINYHATVEENKRALSVYMNVYSSDAYGSDSEGARTFSELLNGARVSFIDGNGNVLADSEAKDLDNHADRAEVAAAMKDGEGYNVRSSKTLGHNMIYYCRKVSDELLVRIALPTPSEWSLLIQLLPTAAVYLVVDIFLCMLLTAVLTYFIVDPIKRLAVTASGEGEVTAKYKELQPIADILNERNRSIKRQIGSLQEEKELVEKAQNSKDTFIQNVTHEMNTPLTSIRGYAELMSVGALDEKQEKQAVDTIIKQSDRLSGLVTCIIHYSEIDSEDLPDEEVNVSSIVDEMTQALRVDANKAEVELSADIAQNVRVTARQELVTEVVGNLMRNAIRYNKRGGSVMVTLSATQLTVADTGVGINERDLDKIFDRFYTIDKSHGGKNGGFGLGLAVVKKICVKYGWHISVSSVLNKGSTFTVTFEEK